ncbi:MAG: hypothetical protein GEU82_04510 [Luteitalea sp.]|nr:hypothetical protein [Luteitalea sp.]
MTAEKKCAELCRESIELARHAAELRQAGLALLKRATELQRQSEGALKRSAQTKNGRRRRTAVQALRAIS